MDKNVMTGETKSSVFEQIKKTDEYGKEYWSSRDMAKVFEYAEYRKFLPVINKAKDACKNSGQTISDHFEDIFEMIEVGRGGKRQGASVKLSRYDCYLIVQNADPTKATVANGQTYFAVQTRFAEIKQVSGRINRHTEEEQRLLLRNDVREHNTKLADAAKDAGVIENRDYAVFQNCGYNGLYGGLDAKDIHKRKGLKENQKILDHMGSTELAANLFRATQAEEKLRREQIKEKTKANQAHYDVGAIVRQTIETLGGVMPENLPTEESIKKVETRRKKMLKSKEDSKKLPK